MKWFRWKEALLWNNLVNNLWQKGQQVVSKKPKIIWKCNTSIFIFFSYVMLCAIWYHLYNLKNDKDTIY